MRIGNVEIRPLGGGLGCLLMILQMLSAPADPRVLEAMRDAGVRRAMRWLPSGPRGPVERALDRWESVIAEFTGG